MQESLWNVADRTTELLVLCGHIQTLLDTKMNDEYKQALKRYEDSLDDWAKVTNHNSESKLAKGMLAGVLDTSTLVDQFSTWLLAGAGATSVLLISNLKSISELFGSINY